MTSLSALAAALASLALLLHGRRFGLWPRPPAAPPGVPPGAVRHRHFIRLTLRTIVHFGVVAVLLLAVTGQIAALWRFPAALDPARATALAVFGGLPWPALAGGVAAGIALSLLLEWRGRRVALGDIGALAPTSRAELGWGVVVAIEAAVTEELFFRLLLPLLVARSVRSAAIGFVAAAVLFGYAHRYQGRAGIAATTVAGVLLTLIYLLSGQLWVAIAVHAALDLNGLVLRPLVSGRAR